MDVTRVSDDWRVTVGLVSGGHFLSHFYALAFPPLFPFLADSFGLSNVELGLLVSVGAVATLLQVPVGGVVDRIGAKWVFVAGVAITAVGILLAGLAPSYGSLLVFSALTGIGRAAFHPADYAMMDAVTGPGTEGRSFSVHTFSGYAGFAAAPAVIGSLGLFYDWQVALIATGAAGLLYALLSAWLLDTHYLDTMAEAPRRERASIGDGLRTLLQPPILVMFAFFLLHTLAGVGLQTFTPVLVVEGFGLSEAVGNTALTAYFTAAAVGVLVGGVLADRVPPRRIIGLGAGGAAVIVGGLGVVPMTFGPPAMVGVIAAVGVLVGLVLPARDRLVNAFSPAGSTGKSFGLAFTGLAVGTTIGPALFGSVIDGLGPASAFLLIGGLYVSGALVVLVLTARFDPVPGGRPIPGDD